MTTQIGVESGADMRALQIQEQITDDERFLLILGVFGQLEGTPEDFVGAVGDAGLAELAYRGPVTGPGRRCGR